MKKIKYPVKDDMTGEYRYNGKWYDYYPGDEIEKDEVALDEYYDREFRRRREDG